MAHAAAQRTRSAAEVAGGDAGDDEIGGECLRVERERDENRRHEQGAQPPGLGRAQRRPAGKRHRQDQQRVEVVVARDRDERRESGERQRARARGERAVALAHDQVQRRHGHDSRDRVRQEQAQRRKPEHLCARCLHPQPQWRLVDRNETGRVSRDKQEVVPRPQHRLHAGGVVDVRIPVLAERPGVEQGGEHDRAKHRGDATPIQARALDLGRQDRRAVVASENLAKVQAPDPDLLPMPTAEEANSGDESADKSVRATRFFEQTAVITPADRAEVVKSIVSVAGKHKLTTAGIYSTSESAEGIFNSRGLANWHTQTMAEISITMLGDDSSGWQKLNSPDVRKLDPRWLAETAARKAVESAHPREIAPGKYTVILEPAAVLDIVGFMFWDYSGVAILDQRSFLNDRIGTQLFGENINICDDAAHPLQAGSPFDGEGMRRQRVPLVENGVV